MYNQIARTAFKYGNYEETEEFIRKIRDLKSINEEEYYPLLLKTNLLARRFERSAAVVLPNSDKSKTITPEIIEFCVGEGLREVFEGRTNFFQALLSLNLEPERLVNEYASTEALGDFYSILIVANGNRKLVRSDVKFSSGVECLYLNFKYQEFFSKANSILNKYEFDPFIGQRIGEIRRTLERVLLLEVLNAYQVVKLDTVTSILGYSDKDIERIISANRKSKSGCSQYQIDPL